jgi:hypothetical protein
MHQNMHLISAIPMRFEPVGSPWKARLLGKKRNAENRDALLRILAKFANSSNAPQLPRWPGSLASAHE